MRWLTSVGAVTLVVLRYWELVDSVLDRSGPPPAPARDGRAVAYAYSATTS